MEPLSLLQNHAKFITDRLQPVSAQLNQPVVHPDVINQSLRLTLSNGLSGQSGLDELIQIITECLADSRMILQLEQNIKGHVESKASDKKIFLMLMSIFIGYSATDDQVRYIAGIVLKNSIKMFYPQMSETFNAELIEIEYLSFLMLLQEVSSEPGASKKIYHELIFIISQTVMKRFNENAEDPVHHPLLLSIMQVYVNHFSLPFLDCLIQTFEAVDDDRMVKFVPSLLPPTVSNLSSLLELSGSQYLQNRTLYFLQILIKNVEWAVDVDPGAIEQSISQEASSEIIRILLSGCFTAIAAPQDGHLFSRFNFQFIEQRRLTAKVLTMVVRDFSKLNQQQLCEIFRIVLQNLVFFAPLYNHFMNRVTKQEFAESGDEFIHRGPMPKQFDASDIDFEEFEQELKSGIVQMISLAQTVIDLIDGQPAVLMQFVSFTKNNRIKQLEHEEQMKELCRQLIQILFSFCSLSQAEIEVLTSADSTIDDSNSFLMNFLETDEEIYDQVSIRLSVIETIEQLGMDNGSFFEKFGILIPGNECSLLQDVIEKFNSPDWLQVQPEDILKISSIAEVDVFAQYSSYEANKQIINQELAIFFMGQFKEHLKITPQVLEKVFLNFEHAHPLIGMRVLWLLEKVSNLNSLFKENKEKMLKEIFEKLVSIFEAPACTPLFNCQSCPFPLKYQCLKSLYRYMKRIKLKTTYGDTQFAEIMQVLLKTSFELLPYCNEDTIHTPIQILTYLSSFDEALSRTFTEVCPAFMQSLNEIYGKYGYDGLLQDDIVDLIKVYASVPDCTSFKQVFVKQIGDQITLFYNCAVAGATDPKMQEQAQMMIDNNQLKCMLSIFNAFLLRNTEFSTKQLPKDEVQFYTGLFKMVCEILNSHRDISVSLNCCFTLASFCKIVLGNKNFTQVSQEIQPVIRQLMIKLSGLNVGIQDPAALYFGHAVLNMMIHSSDEANDIQVLLPNMIARAIKTNLPPITKSFSLPVCYVLACRSKDALPQFLAFMNQRGETTTLLKFIEKLLENFKYLVKSMEPNDLKSDISCQLEALFLAALVEYSCTDNSFAELKLLSGSILQNALVFDLTSYLCKINKSDQQPATEKKDYGDYGDEYGDEMDMYGDYGLEEFGDINMYGVDLKDENLDTDKLAQNSTKKEEHYLLNAVLKGESQASIQSHLTASLRKVGPQTAQKIVNSSSDKGTPSTLKFSDHQKQLLESLF